jgi:hypothetical protein
VATLVWCASEPAVCVEEACDNSTKRNLRTVGVAVNHFMRVINRMPLDELKVLRESLQAELQKACQDWSRDRAAGRLMAVNVEIRKRQKEVN